MKIPGVGSLFGSSKRSPTAPSDDTYTRFAAPDSEAVMTKSNHREPIKFVGMYFIDEHGEDCRTGQIIAQISDGYYLAQFDCTDDNVPPAPLEVLSAADFNKSCDNCGSRHWQFFPDIRTRQRWISWLTTPDPAKDKMGKVVHLKPKPDQPA
jgi:hypothetical protein